MSIEKVFLYVEGVEIPVTEARALKEVARGKWYRCNSEHSFRGSKYDGKCVVIFHRQVKSVRLAPDAD